jgi:hypothetical protein
MEVGADYSKNCNFYLDQKKAFLNLSLSFLKEDDGTGAN